MAWGRGVEDSARAAADRTPQQRFAAEGLVAHPHRLEVCGRPRSLAWPDICANCGAPAQERLRLRKAFYWRATGRRITEVYPDIPGYRLVTADVPYCATCVARHRETLPHVSFLKRWGWFLFNPAQIATIGCAVVLVNFGPTMLANLIAYPDDVMGRWFFGAFVFGVVWTPAIIWWMTRPDRFEPRTDITNAVDVSSDVSYLYEQRRHIYTFRNPAFAEAFARANQARLWTAQDQVRMNRTQSVVSLLCLVALVLAAGIVWFFDLK